MAKLFLSTALLCSTLLLALSSGAAPAKKKRPSSTAPAKAASTPGATPSPGTFDLLEEGELPLSAKGAIVIDSYLGAPLYEKSADVRFFPASTTKILTALLVIEAGGLDQEIEVTTEDSKVGESSLEVKPGDRFTRKQMLYGLLLKSANDVAHALGRDNAGSIDEFAAKMTLRAAELGATNSKFRNPHGLHHLEHFTTARDLAIITRAAMQQPQFREIVGTVRTLWDTPTGSRDMPNHNRLLREFPNCTGVKTGFTNPAQHTLSTAACRNGREVIATVMHDTRQGKWEDCKLLMTYGFDHPPMPGQQPLRFD